MKQNNRTEFIVKRKETNFTIVDNDFIKRKDLSWKAKGILLYVLHLPSDWNISLNELQKNATDGETSFRSGWKELEELGYVERFPVRDKDTKRITHWQTVIREVAKSEVEKPHLGNQDMGNQDMGNHELLSTKELSTKELSTKRDKESVELKGVQETTPVKEESKEQIPYKEIIEYLNKEADRNFNFKAKGNRDLIRARWNEGYELKDFKKAIDNKVIHANDPEHLFKGEFLRPTTLFGQQNFDRYVNEVTSKQYEKSKKQTKHDFGVPDFMNDF